VVDAMRAYAKYDGGGWGRRRVLAIGSLAMSGAFLGGCRSHESRTITVVPRLSSDAEWLSLHVGMSEEADRQHVKLFWHGPSNENDVYGQAKLLEEAVESDAWGIVVRPSSLVAENHVLSAALRKGIPVVVLGAKIGLPQDPHLHVVLEDDEASGRMVSERLKERLGNGEVAIVGLQPELPGSLERVAGLERALHAMSPGASVYRRMTNGVVDGSPEEAELRMLETHPQLRAIVAMNGHEAENAAAAILKAGMKGRIQLVTYDQSFDTFLLLRTGSIDALLVQPQREMGERAVRLVVADHAQQTLTEEALPPLLVTRENVDTDAVQHALRMHREPPW